jgi:two-component system chemotaxis response regulator CheB
MATRDVIVIGGSAGSIEAACVLFAALPADLDAAMFLVVHLPADAHSVLPDILGRAGPLPAAHAVDGEPISPGRVYVAPPDRHLLLDDGAVRLTRGPKENRHRPAIDPLFRSAARQYGSRVIGVILSGNQHDGSAGLLRVKQGGGVAIVQDPESAMFPGMPHSALDSMNADLVLAPAAMAGALVRLVAGAPVPPEVTDPMPSDPPSALPPEAEVAAEDRKRRDGVPSTQACPECHGVLWEVEDGGLLEFRCRVGHGYTAEALLAHQAEELEVALWSALRALEEQHALARRLAARSATQGQNRAAATYAEHAVDAAHHAALIRKALRVPQSEQQLPVGDPAAEAKRAG